MKIHPNLVTLAGVLVTCMVPVETLREAWVPAGLWLLAAGFFDVLDGSLARNSGLERPFGAFWDSTLDRVSEAFVFGGFLLYYGHHQDLSNLLLAFCVCILSLLVSYTRARAEGLGVSCEVGILPRPGRVILLSFGLMAVRLSLALWIVGVLSLVTVAQRVYRVWSQTKV
ncbi:MAG TPA: CDP-alcohol phosphatidyltransferase family protein [bacterium]|nr:CDP-alcohol phosphatidyltransferase family protein [bacterium]